MEDADWPGGTSVDICPAEVMAWPTWRIPDVYDS
jgi:hypothetical protein